MQNHFGDIIKVASANIAAFTLSFSGLEAAVRFSGLFAALIYTCLKIADWIKEHRNK